MTKIIKNGILGFAALAAAQMTSPASAGDYTPNDTFILKQTVAGSISTGSSVQQFIALSHDGHTETTINQMNSVPFSDAYRDAFRNAKEHGINVLTKDGDYAAICAYHAHDVDAVVVTTGVNADQRARDGIKEKVGEQSGLSEFLHGEAKPICGSIPGKEPHKVSGVPQEPGSVHAAPLKDQNVTAAPLKPAPQVQMRALGPSIGF